MHRALQVKNALEQMKNSNEKMRNKLTVTEQRARDNLWTAEKTTFLNVMTELQDEQEHHKKQLRTKVERQIKIVKPEGVSEEDMELYMQNKKPIFTDVIVQSAQASQVYNDINVKHQEIIKLEESLVQIHRIRHFLSLSSSYTPSLFLLMLMRHVSAELFVDMAVLVEAQGDLINSIESHVQGAFSSPLSPPLLLLLLLLLLPESCSTTTTTTKRGVGVYSHGGEGAADGKQVPKASAQEDVLHLHLPLGYYWSHRRSGDAAAKIEQ
jgi:hypothetical protein